VRIVSTSERETILHGRLVQQHKEDSKCVLLSIVHDSFLLERSVGTALKGKEWRSGAGRDGLGWTLLQEGKRKTRPTRTNLFLTSLSLAKCVAKKEEVTREKM